ncbi:MAG TPA: hypothetical protein VIF62_15480 [Labilithrix sp.]
MQMTIETDRQSPKFDDREESWFAKGDRKRSAILPPEPSWVPGVDDSIADAWFR